LGEGGGSNTPGWDVGSFEEGQTTGECNLKGKKKKTSGGR